MHHNVLLCDLKIKINLSISCISNHAFVFYGSTLVRPISETILHFRPIIIIIYLSQ